MRIVLQGGSAWFCADKSAEMRVSEGGLGWSEGEVGDVRVCVAAKVRMIPITILYCHRGRG